MELDQAYALSKSKVDQLQKEIAIFNMAGVPILQHQTYEYNGWSTVLEVLTSRMKVEAPFDLGTKTKNNMYGKVTFHGVVLPDEATAVRIMNAINERQPDCCVNTLPPMSSKNVVYFRRLSYMGVQSLLLSLDPSIQSLLPKKTY